MKHPGTISFLLALALIPQTSTTQEKRALTPEDVVDIRVVYDANISPDGKRIAFVVREPGDSTKPQLPRKQSIWMVPVDGNEPAHSFASSDRLDNTPRWSPDGRWLAFLSNRVEDGETQIWLMHADSGAAEKLTNAEGGVENYEWSPDSRMIAFLTRDQMTVEETKKKERRDDAIRVDHDYKYSHLWVIALDDHKSTLVTRQNIEITDFAWSPNAGSFAIAYTAVPGFGVDMDCSLGVVPRSDGGLLRKLADNVNILGGPNVRWSPDGKTLMFFECAPSRTGYWVSLIDPKGGQVRPFLKDYPGTFWACEWGPDSRHLITATLVGTQVKLLQIDVGTGNVNTLANILNHEADFSVSADGRVIGFVDEKKNSPRDVWSVTSGQPPRRLTNFNPQITSLRLGNVSDFTWRNRKDGQLLHGVLVTPPEFKPGRPFPTIVEAHEGNAAWVSGWQGSWYQWAQLLASNGYVVFLPNVRGVTGQGRKFSEFILTYAGGAFDDTMDGIDSLVALGIADPSRLGIGGWSNGGYMTTWAITHTNRFKAAVPFAAPVDFPVWWGTSDIGRLFELTFGDTPLHARQQYEACSPLYSVQNCKTPTLVMQGKNDPIVTVAQAYEFYHALKALGVESELVIYPREGHWMGERAHQIDFQKRVLAWFDKHLK